MAPIDHKPFVAPKKLNFLTLPARMSCTDVLISFFAWPNICPAILGKSFSSSIAHQKRDKINRGIQDRATSRVTASEKCLMTANQMPIQATMSSPRIKTKRSLSAIPSTRGSRRSNNARSFCLFSGDVSFGGVGA